MTDSINQLITMCTQQAPGQKECDNALRELEVTTTHRTASAPLDQGWVLISLKGYKPLWRFGGPD